MSDLALLPRDPHGQKIASIFDYGWKWLDLDNQNSDAQWRTNNKFPLKPRTLWSYFLDAGRVIGCRFGSSTRYAMLDIDAGSEYLERIAEIKWALETIGVCRTINVRSSHSGGVHIYIPLPQKFPTFGVACMVAQCLEAHGFKLATGQLEAFPNVKRYARSWLGEFCEYAGHRLPLQPATGSILVGDDLQPLAVHDQLSHFLAQWDNAVLCNVASEIGEAIITARANRRHKVWANNGKGKVAQWRADLEAMIAEGWSGPGQTNALLKTIACYGVVFEQLQGEELAAYIAKMATAAPGFYDHCNHRHEIDRRAIAWGRSAQSFYWPLGSLPTIDRTTLTHNDYRASEARERIATAAQVIKHQAMAIRDMATAIATEARCSLKTLYRHLDLWHPEARCVTAHTEGITETLEDVQRQVRESLESVGTWAVTHHGPDNEVCGMKSPPPKNLNSGSGWFPDQNWASGGGNA